MAAHAASTFATVEATLSAPYGLACLLFGGSTITRLFMTRRRLAVAGATQHSLSHFTVAHSHTFSACKRVTSSALFCSSNIKACAGRESVRGDAILKNAVGRDGVSRRYGKA